MNAYPKLRKYLGELPEDMVSLAGHLGLIYDIWLWGEEAQSVPDPVPQTTSHETSQTGTLSEGSKADPSDLRNNAPAGTNDAPAGQNDPTHMASTGRDGYGELFGPPHEGLHSLVSISTPDEWIRFKGDATCTSALVHRSPSGQEGLSEAEEIVRLPKDMHHWILGVEAARKRSALVNVDNLHLDLEQYTQEKARAPPTDDWHSWTSEYAPWYVVLPEDTGVLSSNDWVEVNNYPPLTRALGCNE